MDAWERWIETAPSDEITINEVRDDDNGVEPTLTESVSKKQGLTQVKGE